MKFILETEITDFNQKISHKDKIVFFGSCFSDELSARFKNAGFDVLSNPFGTIFHPLAMARNFENIFSNKAQHHIFEQNKTFFSWNCSSLICKNSEKELEEELNLIDSKLSELLKNTSYLFITFGTAWGYFHNEEKCIVANCHKQKSDLFEKQLTEIDEMFVSWSAVLAKIYKENPKIKIVFTVSPVRHAKDGLIENNRSKARLFEVISRLEKHFPTAYFPSYEIIQDELRDYRFYKEDLIHPNEQAISYVWSNIKTTLFDSKTLNKLDEIEKLRFLANHQVLSSNKEEIEHFEKNRKQKIDIFLKNNSDVKW
ncbi:MAG: GSCFA domain-containing protein [Bacteroidota bacterium]